MGVDETNLGYRLRFLTSAKPFSSLETIFRITSSTSLPTYLPSSLSLILSKKKKGLVKVLLSSPLLYYFIQMHFYCMYISGAFLRRPLIYSNGIIPLNQCLSLPKCIESKKRGLGRELSRSSINQFSSGCLIVLKKSRIHISSRACH